MEIKKYLAVLSVGLEEDSMGIEMEEEM